MTNSFTEKAIRVTFTKASGLASSGNNSNTLVLEGLRCSALVAQDGAKTSLDLNIYGMKNEQMSDISTFGKTFPQVSKDVSVMVEAGDSSGMAVVFIGALIWAWQDFSEMPLAKFHVTAIDVMDYKLRPVPPNSYQGSTDVAIVMSNLAATMGIQFRNEGVSGVQLSDPYLAGTAYDQMQEVAEAAGINAFIDNKTLVIWPKGKARGSQQILISKETGMIGYPLSTQNGIQVSTLFNPSLTWGIAVEVKSGIKQANGTWTILGALAHELQSLTPGGQWRTKFDAWNTAVIPPQTAG